MATKKLVRITHRIDSTDNWKTNNPILSKGEIGIDEDANKIKIGNGSDGWNNLEYVNKTFDVYYVDETNNGVLKISSFAKPFYIISLLDDKEIKIEFEPDLNTTINSELAYESDGVKYYMYTISAMISKNRLPGDLCVNPDVHLQCNGETVTLDAWNLNDPISIKYSSSNSVYKYNSYTFGPTSNIYSSPVVKFSYTIIENSIRNNVYLVYYVSREQNGPNVSSYLNALNITNTPTKSSNGGVTLNRLSSDNDVDGFSWKASGEYSTAEGCVTDASGKCSHAEGYYTQAIGYASHAEGEETEASGSSSHAEGFGTTAESNNQHVQGQYNIKDSSGKYAHIVGNGRITSADNSNAHTLDWNGNSWYAGNIKIGGTSYDDTNAKEIATKEYVDTLINELKAKINS